MAESRDTQAKTDSRERSSRSTPAPIAAAPVAPIEGVVETLGVDFSEATFQRHADLLGDSRFAHRSNAGQRAVVVRRLQRDYGNAYVQRLVSHISRSKADQANGPIGDSPLVQAAREEERRGDVYEPSPEVTGRIEKLRGSGRPMEPGTRQEMESTFGRNLGGVRIHTGSEADRLNTEVSAEAFTTGNDIYFAAGNYSPGSQEGTELLAHELTHVVEQNGGSATMQPEISTETEDLNGLGETPGNAFAR